jgi:Late embryogenesis abundant protein
MPPRLTLLPRRAALMTLVGTLLLPACALMPGIERLRVSVVGIEPMAGQGLELRFKLRLRVLNPNDTPVVYDGVFVELDLQGRNFASGVSDLQGTVPRFSEQVLEVPITVSALGALRQMLGLAHSGAWPENLAYELRGKIGGPAFQALRFESKGELSLPATRR